MAKKAFQKFKKAYLKLVMPEGSIEPEVAHRVIVADAIAVISVVSTIVAALLQAATGYFMLVLTDSLPALLFAAVIVLNRFGWHFAARVHLLVCTHAAVMVYSLAYGNDVGLKYVLFPLMALPFLVFLPRERGAIFGFCFLSVVCLIAIELLSDHWPPALVVLPPAARTSMRAAYPLVSISGLFMSAYMLFSMMESYAEELRIKQALALQAAKMSSLGEMAAGIAHEINNPLAIIIANANLLQMRRGWMSEEEVVSGLTSIIKTAHRIAAIIKGMRAFSGDAESLPVAPEQVGDVIADTLAFCTERFRNHGIDLQVDVRHPARVICNRIELSQAFLNLLNNAFDAVDGRQQSWIRVSVETGDMTVSIHVDDSGPGVPEAIRDRIMEPFYTTKPVGKGTGLGLSITSGIIERFGGQVRLDGTMPFTRFSICLPNAESSSDVA